MSEGQKAAEETKSVFEDFGHATESLRQNINSYADNLVGGNREHGGSGIHPDAKRTGEKIDETLGGSGSKTNETVGSSTKPSTTTS